MSIGGLKCPLSNAIKIRTIACRKSLEKVLPLRTPILKKMPAGFWMRILYVYLVC